MKNTLLRLSFLLYLSLPVFVFGQSYQAELSKLNTFLKTFDNGYYGYLEVKDGYLYDRFPSGKYTKTAIKDLGQASEVETKRKVQLFCKDNANCVFSTYTNSNHSAMSFSQSNDFNTAELITLLNNLVAALQGKSSSTSSSSSSSSASAARLEREKNAQQKSQPGASSTVPAATDNPIPAASKYSTQLDALNNYLKTFNPEIYGEVSVKEGKVFFEFKVYTKRYYSSIPITVLTQKTLITKGSTLGNEEVKIQCLGEADCFYSSYTEENTDHFRFFSNTVKDLTKMQQLVEDMVKALK